MDKVRNNHERQIRQFQIPRNFVTVSTSPVNPQTFWGKFAAISEEDLVAGKGIIVGSMESAPKSQELIHPETFEYLQQLCDLTGKSQDEVLQAALSLFGLAAQAKAQEKKLGVVELDTPTITEVVGF